MTVLKKIVPSILLAFTVLAMQGCASLSKKSFEPANAEMLSEWQLEGEARVKYAEGKERVYVRYTQIKDGYRLELRSEKPIGDAQAILEGKLGQADSQPSIQTNNPEDKALAETFGHLPLDYLAFWLRALPVTASARIETEAPGQVASIEEQGWRVEYRDFMEMKPYRLPAEIELSHDDTRVRFDLVRGEVGYLTNPCPDAMVGELVAQADAERSDVASNETVNRVERLVPSSGEAPLPRWINKQDFCRQLFKVHGKIPDPRIGLYGPDSMMWKLSGPLLPAGMGAGRALLLQTAHPWVTQGIDEHSIVRDDPMERARRTFTNVATMTYGSMPQVMRSAHLVHRTHEQITGEMPYQAGAFEKHSEYRANEVNAMIWVHATLWETLVRMYEEYEEPLTLAEKDRFYEETKLFAMLFGIPESVLPKDWEAFMAYNEAMWNSPQLTVTDATLQLKEDLFDPQSIFLVFPLWMQEVVTAGNLPPRIRDQYEMNYGAWRKFNNAWIKTMAKFTDWVLPEYFAKNAVHHEAEARLQGERVGGYHQMLIESFLGTERLVN